MAVGADVINANISTRAIHDEAIARATAADIVVLAIGTCAHFARTTLLKHGILAYTTATPSLVLLLLLSSNLFSLLFSLFLHTGIAQCGCMGIVDTYMGGKATNPGGCATSVVPPYTPWGNCWGHQEVT